MKRWMILGALAVGASAACESPLIVATPMDETAPATVVMSEPFEEVMEVDSARFVTDVASVSELSNLRATLHGTAHGNLHRRLTIFLRGMPLEPGVYELSHFDLHDPSATGALVWYERLQTDRAFTSVRGRLEVVEVSADRFAGHFEMEAHNCTPSRNHCGDDPPATVAGTFSATPARRSADHGQMEVRGPATEAVVVEGIEGFFQANAQTRIGVPALTGSFRGINEAGEPYTVGILVHGRRDLEAGVYELSHFGLRDPEDGGVLMWYAAHLQGLIWTSVGGTLRVTEATSGRLSGTAEFEGRNCDPSRDYCGELPPVHVRGTFSLVPYPDEYPVRLGAGGSSALPGGSDGDE